MAIYSIPKTQDNIFTGIASVFITGLSTDTKPTETVPSGSTFLETDTGILFSFNGTIWVPPTTSLGVTGYTGYTGFTGVGTTGYTGYTGAGNFTGYTGYSGYTGYTGYTGPSGSGYTHVSTSSGATTTGANTTPVDVSGAVFTYVQNAVYRIWVMGRINSTAATTGVGIHFNLSTAITDINVLTTHPLTTATPGNAYSISDDASEGVSTGVPAGPLDVPFVTNALLRPGNNTGTCQLRLRSETTAVTELLAGVTMVVERVI